MRNARALPQTTTDKPKQHSQFTIGTSLLLTPTTTTSSSSSSSSSHYTLSRLSNQTRDNQPKLPNSLSTLATTTTPNSLNTMDLKKMSQKALERKSNKPIMEKKRRARINHCLNQLKALILETDNERSRHSKLEKADILEMTVRYLQTLRTYHLHLHQLQQLHQQTNSNATSNTTSSSAASSPVQQHQQPQQLHQLNLHQLPQLHHQLNLHHHHLHHHQQIPANLQLQSPHSPTWRPW